MITITEIKNNELYEFIREHGSLNDNNIQHEMYCNRLNRRDQNQEDVSFR